ncbi:MAG: HAD-IC family P-type ATPase [Patescibacteria group bacterium]|nr:HAD-IC family P-type ATPase [Patescibacteria group bacterium]
MSRVWHTLPTTDVLKELRTSQEGLSDVDVEERQQQYGPNTLPTAKPPSFVEIFLRQFKSPLIYVLLAAALIMVGLGEWIDAAIIAFVLIFNATLGSIQEGRAQDTLNALRHFTETQAVVRRGGKEYGLSDKELVPGDIIFLHEGEKVPADARVINANSLKINEAALTGESQSVEKQSEVFKKQDAAVSDQRNMIFRGTYVLAGSGLAVVTSTGLETAIGKISRKLQTIDREMPLQKNFRGLSRLIVATVIIADLLLLWIGLSTGRSLTEMFAVVVTLSVSIIPEGLIIVLTVVLAAGVWRMSRKKALVRRLQAVEALGQAQILAVDKTGTLTRNEMMVETIYIGGQTFKVSGNGYESSGVVTADGSTIEPLNHPEVLLAGRAASLVSNVKLWRDEKSGNWRLIGDPTEAALLVFGSKIGFAQEKLEEETPRLLTIPFDHKRRYDAVWYKQGKTPKVVVAGAPEEILKLSNKVWRKGRKVAMSVAEREKIDEAINQFSRRGLRVLAFALGSAAAPTSAIEKAGPLTFGGLFGISDAVRPEVIHSLELARQAGIKVVMITGDHKATAKAVASTVGIYHRGDTVLTGVDIDAYDDRALADNLSDVSVFARVTPEHKLRIVQAYKKNKLTIAMTGDGVNDAPSLVAADLGVAMGKIGTEVAKEAADIILLDDNIGSVILAVEEGRGIYQTIRKVILYLFSTGMGEMFCIGGAILLGWPLPVLPGQIIWLNLVTDSFLDVALSMDPKEPGLLRGSYPKPKKYIVDWAMGRRMFLMAAVMAIGSLWIFSAYLDAGADLTKAITITMTALAVYQWFNVWNCRSEKQSIFRSKPWSNRFLIGATFIVVGLQLLAIYHPWFQQVLKTTALGLIDWLIIIAVALPVILVEEGRKWLSRRWATQPAGTDNKAAVAQGLRV